MSKDKFADYSSTAASNTDVGGVNIQGSASIANGDDAFREVMSHIADHFAQDSVADSATPDLGAKAAHYLTLAGTTTITSFGTIKAGTVKFVKFDSARTITRNATSLITLTGTDRTTTANSVGVYVSEGSGNWRELAYWDASTGVLLTERTAPATAASQGALYTKDSGTQPELFYREESSGDEVQLTSNGGVRSSVLGTAASLSGSSQDFTIPSWANVIKVSFYNVSHNGAGTRAFSIVLGDSGGVETTGYLSSFYAEGGSVQNGTAAFFVTDLTGATGVVHGTLTLTRVTADGTIWAADGQAGFSNAAGLNHTAGSKVLSAALTTVRFQVGGDSFDSGTVNVVYW